MRPLKKRIAREFEQADEDSSRARRNEPKARQEPAQQGFFNDKLPLDFQQIGRPNAVNNTPMPGQYSQGFFKQMLPENVESSLKNLPPLPKLPIQSHLPPRPPCRPRSRIPRLPPRPPRPPGALPMPYSLRSRPKTQLVPPPWVHGLPKQVKPPPLAPQLPQPLCEDLSDVLLDNLEEDYRRIKNNEKGYNLLTNYVGIWKNKTKNGKKDRKVSAIELLNGLQERYPKERDSINEIKARILEIGMKLSELLVEYTFLFEFQDMSEKIKFVKNTMQILILDEGSTSILIEKLHSTLLSIIGGRFAYARHFYTIVDEGKSPYRNGAELESFEKKESNVNDAMFFNIFYLENCLNYPYYDVNTNIAQLSSSVKCFREKFLQKLGVTSCMINNVKSKFRCVYDYDEQDRERVRKFKDMKKEEIKDIWKNLSLR
ncbi:hypothetical protein CsatA_023399 [Cannabis sativa]